MTTSDERCHKVATTTDTRWHGYTKRGFPIGDHGCFVVEPHVAAPGRPWVWRTSFPEFHSEIDQELLHLGWHICFVDVVDMLGCDAALDVMDCFYDCVREQWLLAPRPALEAVSRGGLHAYRYAARHPGRVACVYADTPVMDLKSWPLACRGCKREVADAIRHYGFRDEAELTSYEANPIDLLDAIADAGIPLRHLISLNDVIVPPEQNTLEAQRLLESRGHAMDLVTVAAGTPESGGHHFPLPYMFETSRFIAEHSYVLPSGREYYNLRAGLGNVTGALANGRSVRVACLGGSITFNPGWREEIMRYLVLRYPEVEFDFIAAGIPSIGSNGHAFRLARDVLSSGPVDLVFFEAAVNDTGNCEVRPIERLRGAEGTIYQLREVNPGCDVVMLHFVMPEHMDAFRGGRTPDAVLQHERVAEHYGCASVNLSLEVTERIDAGEFSWEHDFVDLHPSPYGQRVYTNSILRMLDAGLASNGPAVEHRLPATLLDPYSYTQGRFGALEAGRVQQGFRLEPAWAPTDGVSTRAGFAHMPALVGETAGDCFEYPFNGRGIGLFLAAGPDTGMIDVSIDGGEVARLDTFTVHSGGLHLPSVCMLADELEDGPHTLRLTIADEHHPKSSGHALRIIHILLNECRMETER